MRASLDMYDALQYIKYFARVTRHVTEYFPAKTGEYSWISKISKTVRVAKNI